MIEQNIGKANKLNTYPQRAMTISMLSATAGKREREKQTNKQTLPLSCQPQQTNSKKKQKNMLYHVFSIAFAMQGRVEYVFGHPHCCVSQRGLGRNILGLLLLLLKEDWDMSQLSPYFCRLTTTSV